VCPAGASSRGRAPALRLQDDKGRVRLELVAGADGGRVRVLGPKGEVEFESP
jgi:hypothetical protein